MKNFTKAGVLASVVAVPALGNTLYSNGPVVTNPTGGTGSIAGLPISVADSFTIPGQSFLFSTLGVAATVSTQTAAAEDFVVPAGIGGWDLDSVTLYAFQTGQNSPSITAVHINLWTAPPYSADSPPPVPDPLPVPVLVADLVLPAGPGTFVAHRESTGQSSSVRPVFSYTVSLDGLPNGGRLAPGTYWLQWSFEGASSPSANVFMPLVSPRTAASGWNARLLNSLDGSAGSERVWFEGREGFVAGVADGRAYALPFELQGTVITVPACYANCDSSTASPVLNVGDFTCFLQKFAEGDPYANCDGSTTVPVLNVGDFTCFLQQYAAGCP